MGGLWTALVAVLAVIGAAVTANARPFNVDDLLHQQSLGAVATDPSGRWLIYERRDHYDSAERFNYYSRTSQALGRLQVVDLMNPPRARPLFRRDPGPGILLREFSPSGARLAVIRMRGGGWTLGVATIATGGVRWFDLTPQDVGRGRTLQWLSDTELLLIARADGAPPSSSRVGWILADRLPRYWDAAARGGGAHTVLGSGAYASVRERSADRAVIRLDVVTGRSRTLAKGEFFDLELSPDRTFLALFESGRDLQSRNGGPARGAAGLETEATRLSLLHLRSGRREAICPACDVLPQLLSWSPSGRSLLFLTRGANGLWTSGQLLRLHAAAGAIAPVADGIDPQFAVNPVTLKAGWMGEDPLVLGRRKGAAGTRADWFRLAADGAVNLTAAVPGAPVLLAADSRGLSLAAEGRLWRADPTGRSKVADLGDVAPARRTAAGTEGARLNSRLPESSWIVARQGGAPGLYLADAIRVEPLGPGAPAPGDLAAASLSTRSAIYRNIDGHGVETLTLVGPRSDLTLVDVINPDLSATDVMGVAPVWHVGLDGRALTSWIYLPSRGDGPAPPLVVRPYLGDNHPTAPRDRYMEVGFMQNLRMLTGHGYAVLVPSLPNPPEGMVEPANHLADRILDIVRAAADDPGLSGCFDPDRLALTGWSFGGYTVLATLTQTDRFRAAVAMDGISDLVGYWGHLALVSQIAPEAGYASNWITGGVETVQPRMETPPWANPERYARNSPLLFANRITTPLLLVHGAQDELPIAQSEAMYSSLFRQGKDAMLVTYWGANHMLTSPGDVRDVYARTFRFLDEHLSVTARPAAAPSASPERASASGEPRPQPTPPKGCLSARPPR